MHVGRGSLVGFAVAVLALLQPTNVALAETRALTGTVTYRERIALPPSAVVEVKLVDISLADAPSVTLAETSMSAGQVPISYRLQYDTAAIKPGRTYALQARITVDGQLWFITAMRHAVFASDVNNTDIIVERVKAETRFDPASPTGRWLAENINNGGVIDRLQTVLELGPDGTISGTGGCNRMSGKAIVSGDKITFGPIASTNKACAPAIMDQEGKFFAALAQVRSWSIHTGMRKLTLCDADGRPIIVFALMQGE